MSIMEIITTDEARQGFYPTPFPVAEKLLEGVNWNKVHTILEPSAGKGDLLRAAVRCAIAGWPEHWGRYERTAFEADVVEIDPYLRSILQYEYGGQKRQELASRLHDIDRSELVYDEILRKYVTRPELEAERKLLEPEHQLLKAVEARVVHDDFLTMDTRKQYDLILMNPPFANGDEHLLKALEMQRRHGGEVRCILNAETILNPYTNRRKALRQQLADLDADVQIIEGGFMNAERQTDVAVAIIKVSLPVVEYESTIFKRMQEAARLDEFEAEDVTDLAVTDLLARIVTEFNVEVDAGLTLIHEYIGLRRHIGDSISMTVGDRGQHSPYDQNDYVRVVRRKYWQKLFDNPKFTAKLTSNLRDKYRNMVDKMAGYDFSLFNIQQVMAEMNAEMSQGVQDTIVALFDRMTSLHTYYPECIKNIHYFSGWKTNKAHKVNNKVILPVHGLTADPYWSSNTINVREAEATISDIEKVFDYLDGNLTAEVDLHGVLERANEAKQTKNIRCKFFDVTLYKKGTMHIKFHDQALVDRFNIYCSQKKNWLPPNYGRTTYADMTHDERIVVDEFNGNGSEGSGAKAYAEILERQAYYLADPGNKVLALAGV